MALVKWNSEYETGIPSIDAQHRSLFTALNQLHDAIGSEGGSGLIAQTLDFLVDYAGTHFRDEEARMLSLDFPGLREHEAEHRRLLSQVADSVVRYKSNPTSASAEALAAFLVDWLTDHIMLMDKQFANSMRARGVL